jgi:hypothetical protein
MEYVRAAGGKLGDGLIYAVQEVKFWGEVLSEFLELEGSVSDRHLGEVRQQIREQIQETEQYEREVQEIKRL